MSNLFDIIGGKVVISNSALAIPAFKDVWEKSKDKEHASKVISYIVFMHNPSSPYVDSIYEEDRKEKLMKELFGGDYSLTEVERYAESSYIEFLDTLSLKLLRGVRAGLEQSSKYLTNMEYESMDMRRVKEILDIASKVDKSIKSIDSLERQVKKDELNNTKVRGGSEIGWFELPRK